MKLSAQWLAQYVDLPADLEDLARGLTAAGLAVEGTETHEGDTVLDVEVTTNRPDCMNHFGLAREISVIYGLPLKPPAAEPSEAAEKTADACKVLIEDDESCPRFVARVVRGVKIGPSPDWLKKRLEAIGLRSINNVVDVTNFILWELGQPLHAYDLAKLAESTLVVRRARAGERLTTLDGVERELSPDMLVIADTEAPVGLGGVMGGADSEVTGTTQDILIEGAHFDRKRVRMAARRLGMHTDASHRFERGADPGMCGVAVARAAALIAEVAGGTVLAGDVDVRNGHSWNRQGRLDLARLDAFAGATIDPEESQRWLSGLGFEVDQSGGTVWNVTVPTWRYYDFQPRPEPPHEVYPQDLYEEVLRIYGLDRIEAALPAIPGFDAPRQPHQVRRERARQQLAASGYVETVHFAFLDPARDASFPSLRPGAKPMRLANPPSEQYAVLRRSLVPNLVDTARFNQRRGLPAVRMFEIATVFYDQGKGEIPDQPEHLALVCGGHLGNPWQREVDLDFFDLKGVLEALAAAFGVSLDFRPAELPGLLAGNSAELVQGGKTVGYLGRVEDEEGYALYVAELAMDVLAGGNPGLAIRIPSRFPGISADFTLTHPLDVPWTEIDRAIAELAPPDLVSWDLKVRYRGQGVPEGAVNTTLSFQYNALDRSLTQEEVNARQLGLSQELERRFGWKG